MEGSVSEEPKSVQKGAEASHGVKRKRVKKKLATGRLVRMQRGADASHGEMGGGSKHHQLERKRVKDDSASGVQSGVDATRGQTFGVPESHLVKCKIIQEKCVSRVQSGKAVRPFSIMKRYDRIIKKVELMRANVALEFYQKSHQGGEFEIIAVLHASTARLTPPGYGPKRTEKWCHLSFIAKPKNADCGDVSPKFFFAELVDDDDNGKFYATYCSTFKPRYSGPRHNCVFCMLGQRFHPRNGYRVGRAPWEKAPIKYLGD